MCVCVFVCVCVRVCVCVCACVCVCVCVCVYVSREHRGDGPQLRHLVFLKLNASGSLCVGVFGVECLEGLVHITVSLQCERSARGTARGQSRQEGARARGGARDLYVTLSGVRADDVSLQQRGHGQLELDPLASLQCGLTRAALRRRLLGDWCFL